MPSVAASSSPSAPARLLLLEDSPEEAHRLLGWLRSPEGGAYQVVHTTSVSAARAQLAAGGFDVALLDLCVDDSRGLPTFLACHAAAPTLPFVVQSGLDGDAVAVEAVQRGAQDYLVKGRFTVDLLRRSLRYARERARTERELTESRERYRLALAGANDGIWDWDIPSGRFAFADRFWEMLGCRPSDQGNEIEDWLAVVHDDDREAMVDALFAHLRGESAHFEVEYRVWHLDGGLRWMHTRGMAVRNAEGVAVRMAGSQSDVTERRRAEERLHHQARHDALTDLPNRAAFRERLEEAIRRSAEPGGAPFAVLFLDLDRFKVVNDSLGHLAGDRLLVAVAQRLRTNLRPGDLVARLGGDEFALLLTHVDAPLRSAEVAARIHRSMAAPFQLGGSQLFASVSIGMVRYEGGGETADEILRNADIAMYRSKRSGTGGTEVFDEAYRVAAAGRLEMENGLREALADGRIELQYQPIVRLEDRALVGFEALARLRDRDGHLVSPAEFIPIAEETGVIHELGAFVLQAACSRMAALSRALPETAVLSIAVNVSPQQFTRSKFVDLVEDSLRRSGLAADRLVLELTETALMENPETASRVVDQLRRIGVRIHLDDFGMGYSSLGYLRRFRVDSLKIDRSFIHCLPGGAEDDAIVRAIVALADAFGMPVVAEGVENAAQLAHLGHLHCAHGQGYYFSPPVDGEELPVLARGPLAPRSVGVGRSRSLQSPVRRRGELPRAAAG
jgi:diguanylate cyclase (GGDEF)-like protein/PAS domain S-box-containing protein